MPNTEELKRQIAQGAYDAALTRLYGAEALPHQRERYTQTIEQFAQKYGAEREVRLYSAPGRTEIGGNHTDHQNGCVMAAAVNLDVIAVVAKSDTMTARVKSQGFDKEDVIDLNDLTPNPKEEGRSSALVRGVAAGIVARGGKIGGFDAYTTSDVLRGSGLSSSAAFEVVLGAVLNGEYNDGAFSAVEIAKISQGAENIFFGKPSGLMDQTACSVGSAITIDFQNPATPIVTEIALDLEKHGYVLCITDTKGSHAGLTDDYAAIRAEMESVAAYFGKAVLREVSEQEFYNSIAAVRKKTSDRAVLRAMHFFADSARVEALSEAVVSDRFSDFLSLILDGGHSSFEYNQNAYSPRNPKEQGVALGLALSQRVLRGKGAWRLQGGGFAGTIQAFVPKALQQEYAALLDSVFGEGSCRVLNVRSYGAVPVTPAL